MNMRPHIDFCERMNDLCTFVSLLWESYTTDIVCSELVFSERKTQDCGGDNIFQVHLFGSNVCFIVTPKVCYWEKISSIPVDGTGSFDSSAGSFGVSGENRV